MLHVVACPIVFLLFCGVRLAGRSVQDYVKSLVFSVFSRLGSFSQVSRQVKEWTVLKSHKTRRISHVIECPIVFILFYERHRQGGVFKSMKNDHFQVFLAIWVLFLKLLGR